MPNPPSPWLCFCPQEWKLKQLQFLAEQDMPHDKGAEADAARSGGNDGAEPPAAAHDVVSVD